MMISKSTDAHKLKRTLNVDLLQDGIRDLTFNESVVQYQRDGRWSRNQVLSLLNLMRDATD